MGHILVSLNNILPTGDRDEILNRSLQTGKFVDKVFVKGPPMAPGDSPELAAEQDFVRWSSAEDSLSLVVNATDNRPGSNQLSHSDYVFDAA